jgi:PhzF family phenazine biosynthesis protein
MVTNSNSVRAAVQLSLHQVDAFTDAVFGGNPAAVVSLDRWLPDRLLQAIAAENNLSETAFVVAAGEAWELRWFTPAVEVDLCGHATLAAAYVLATAHAPGHATYRFRTRRAGDLKVDVAGDLYTLDFPARPAVATIPHPGLVAALGGSPETVMRAGHNLLAVYRTAEEVRALAPRFAELPGPEGVSVIATAPGPAGIDFVSRYFAPAMGIDEDPVTGSAHCTLVPYWAARLGRADLEARQISARGGALSCRLAGDRVRMTGRVAPYLEGRITVPDA